jgi:hypothetical protein
MNSADSEQEEEKCIRMQDKRMFIFGMLLGAREKKTLST